MPCPAASNIFLFNGKEKNGAIPTESGELKAWLLATIASSPRQARITESFDYSSHVKNANDSKDEGVIALLKEEIG